MGVVAASRMWGALCGAVGGVVGEQLIPLSDHRGLCFVNACE